MAKGLNRRRPASVGETQKQGRDPRCPRSREFLQRVWEYTVASRLRRSAQCESCCQWGRLLSSRFKACGKAARAAAFSARFWSIMPAIGLRSSRYSSATTASW